MPTPGELPYPVPRGMIIVIILLLIAVITAGFVFYQSQEQQIKDTEIKDLTSIALLKSNQIAGWRQNRLYDGQVISSSPFFINGVDHYLTFNDADSRDNILERFREMNVSPLYDNIQLVDQTGTVRLSLNPSDTSVHPQVIDQLNASLQSGDPVLTDLYWASDTQSPHMDLIAPLLVRRGDRSVPVGAVVYSIDPNDFLYPLIQSWPVPSESAETLLIEREDDHVLFLNELRQQNNTALNLTIPLTQTGIPAVMAVKGITGAFEGSDYRGVNVISVLEPVPGSPWFMVTKIDTAEMFSSWRSRSVIIIALVAGAFASIIIVVGLVWQRRQKYYYRTLYTAETEQRREEQRNRERSETLLHLAEMESASKKELADFVLDAGCRLTNSPLAFIGVMSADESIFDITAWSKSAMKDCSVAASPIHYPIAKAGIWAEAVRQRKPFLVNDYPASQPGKMGLPPGHVPITRFASVPIFDNQRIVMVCAVANSEINYTDQDVNNLTLLMQGVWSHLQKRLVNETLRQKNTDLEAAYEEITASDEELAANYEDLARSQKALAESERKYRNLYQFAQVGLFETSMKDATVVACNERYATLAGFSSIEEARGKDILHLYANAEDRTEVSRILREKGSIEDHTVKFRNPHTGAIFWGQFSARYNYERDVAEGSIIDITAQKEAEIKLRENEERLVMAQEIGHTGSWEYDLRTEKFQGSAEAARIYGFPPVERIFSVDAIESCIPERERVHRALVDLIQNEKEYNLEFSINPADRSPQRVILSIARLEKDEQGNAIRIVGVIHDITERKRAETELAAAQQQYRELFEGVNIGILRTTPGSPGTIIEANPASLRIFEADSHEQFLAIHPSDIYFDPDQRRRVVDEILDDGSITGMEVRFRTLRGRPFWGWITSTRKTAPDGSVYFDSTIEDITEKKVAETEREENARQRQLALDAARLGWWHYDPVTKIASYDERYREIFGVTGSSCPNEELLPLLHPDDHPRVWAAVERALDPADPHPYAIEYRVNAADGVMRWVQAHGKAGFEGDGEKRHATSFVGTVEDITERKRAEELLRESEARLAMALDVGNAGIWQWNLETAEIFLDDRFHHLLGYSPGELPHTLEEWLSYHNTDDVPVWKAKAEAYLRGDTPVYESEHRIRTRTGEWGWIFTRGQLVTSDVTGSKKIFLGIAMNVTGRRLVEEALHAAHERLQSFIDANVVGFVIASPEGEIIETNDYYLNLIGYTRKEFEEGMIDWRSLTPPEWLPADEHAIEELREQGKCTPYEKEYIRRDGSRVPVLLTDSMLSGPQEHIAALALDITERKQAEERLHETNEYLQNLVDYANAPIIVWNPEFHITRFNHASERLTGRTEQEVIGRHLALLFPESSRDASLDLIKKTLSGERWDVVEIPILHTSGEIRIVLWNSATLFSEDKKTVIATIAQGQDITDRKSMEDALRESEEKYRELFENITSGFALHEILLDDAGKPVDYRFLMVNPAFEQMTGLEGSAIINHNVLEVLPGTEPYWIETYGRVALSGKPERFENFSHLLNKWFEVLVYRPKRGQFATVFTDITERIRVEEALRTNEHELDALFRSMINAFALFDSVFDDKGNFVSYRFVRINDAYERITGVKNEDVRGKTVEEVWPGTESGWIKAYGEVAVTGVPATFDMYHEPTKKLYHCNVYRPGESRDRFCVIFEDITERNKAEEALKESEERFRVIFERSTVGKSLTSPEGNILRINPAFAEMLGYTIDEIQLSDFAKITYPDDLAESRECIRALLAGEVARYRMEKRYLHKAGRIVWTDVSTSLLKDKAGKPLYFITSILDITERKRTERQRETLIKELEQKNAELERFTYTVSHDLKSPLITIRGFAGLLEDDVLKGDPLQLKKDIHRILDAAATMQALLSDLLELSRIGRVVNPSEKISFTRIVRESIDILAGPLAERGVAVDIAPDLPDVVVDHTRIREVMVNLIENAIKFLGDQPDPVIRIGVQNTGEGTVFFVQDNGIGINPKYLERIFNLFEKLDPSAPGTGIGLSIVRRIIEVHGGKIWVESEGLGMGTKVCFTLDGVPAKKGL
ncbi:MAG: PAS domain S-box protein [Methanoregula sp.]|nr:PAS domain S-box protein [Methanoregula sp.]